MVPPSMFAPSATGPGRCDRAARARVFAKCSAAPLEPDSTADFVEPSGHFSDEILEARLRLNGPRMTRMTRMSFGMTKRDCRMSKSESIQARVLRLEHCSSALARTTDQRLVRRSRLLRRSCCGGWIRGGGSPISDHTIRAGFTLLELLLVVGIIGLLLVLIAPAFTYIKGGTDVTSAAYTIKGVLDTARTYAKANNTYVWVGFFEEDGSISSASPTATPGNGRVVVSTVASKDGTEVYDLSTPGSADMDPSGTRLTQVGKLVKLDNMHLRTFANGTGAGDTFSGRPSPSPSGSSDNAKIGDTSPPDSLRYFHYPPNGPEGAAQYIFRKMIQFSPRGECRPQNDNYEMRTVVEVGVQLIHGAVPPALDDAKNCAVQLTGFDGNVKIYRK
jgi:prepilin-type N-terminal cleavage/methylation domain-containing protein